MSFPADLQAHAQTATLIDGVTGWPSTRRIVHDDSDQLVVFTEDGGLPPEASSPTGIGDSAMRYPSAQILVRGEPYKGDAARAKADALHALFYTILRTAVNGTTYTRIKTQTEPLFSGFDDKHRPVITFSVAGVLDA